MHGVGGWRAVDAGLAVDGQVAPTHREMDSSSWRVTDWLAGMAALHAAWSHAGRGRWRCRGSAGAHAASMHSRLAVQADGHHSKGGMSGHLSQRGGTGAARRAASHVQASGAALALVTRAGLLSSAPRVYLSAANSTSHSPRLHWPRLPSTRPRDLPHTSLTSHPEPPTRSLAQ